jgi:hypothetical protein
MVMAAKLTRLTHKIAIQLHHLQFSQQAASPETFGYNLENRLGGCGMDSVFNGGIWQ